MNNNDEKKEILSLILGLSEDEHRKSTLQLALSQARHMIGYDKNKGISFAGYACRHMHIQWENDEINVDLIEDERNNEVVDICDAFSALTFYLIALDQLGHIFIKNKRTVRVSDILELSGIVEFNEEETRMAIQQLRNSLCHSFSLANDKKPIYKYVLCFDDEEMIVKLPLVKYNSDWKDKSEDSKTIIYVFPLCNAIEKAIANIVSLFERGEIQCRVTEIEELETRFTILN